MDDYFLEVVSNPRGSIKWSGTEAAAQVRAVQPVFCGICGCTNTTFKPVFDSQTLSGNYKIQDDFKLLQSTVHCIPVILFFDSVESGWIHDASIMSKKMGIEKQVRRFVQFDLVFMDWGLEVEMTSWLEDLSS